MVLRIRKRNRLPHWDVERGIYFVTFTLHDALPSRTREHIEREAAAVSEALRIKRGDLTLAERDAVQRFVSRRIHRALDSAAGACWLARDGIAEIVANALRFFDGQRYHLLAWCVMPNHVHVVFSLLGESRVDDIVRSWKGFTARQANRVLGRTGTFWRCDYYDRTVRDADELGRIITYVLSNPAKGKLVDWPWLGSNSGHIAAIT